MSSLKWEIQSKAVEAKLQKMKLQGADMSGALGAMGGAIANRIRLGFRLGRSPYGNPWKPINPAFRAGQPLRDTGRLQRSITSAVQGDSALVGTNVIYARTHQYGAKIKPVKGKTLRFALAGGGFAFPRGVTIPARPFMPIGPGGGVELPAAWSKSALTALSKAMGL